MSYQVKNIIKRLRKFPQRVRHHIVRGLMRVPGASTLVQRLLLQLAPKQFMSVLSSALTEKTFSLQPQDALKLLFELENNVYHLEGKHAIRYGNGLHTKHRHINYHDFFVSRLESGNRVLDVGCGNGALACDIATQGENVSVYGIDLLQKNIDIAKEKYSAENITFVCGNALTDLPEQAFDVIVLSNVLEHIEHRVEFLKGLQTSYHPKKFLIRVPVFERDWRVPLKEELNIDYRLDPTHYIEYRQGEFEAEIAQAGLSIIHAQVNWGEIWAEVVNMP